MNNEHNKLDYKIKKLVELYLNNVKFDDLSKIEEILAAGNSPTCHFQNINEFFSHYQEFSNNKNLDKNKVEMILNYFSSNGYILKTNNQYSKENKHTRFSLVEEDLIYRTLEIYNKTKHKL